MDYLPVFSEFECKSLEVREDVWDQWFFHRREWDKCSKCPLGTPKKARVLVRGTIPAQVVFVGEAPGVDENAMGLPFVGKSGRLLEALIQETRKACPFWTTYAITNLVACKPFEGSDILPPEYHHISECSPRVSQFLELSKPAVVITLGGIAHSYLNCDTIPIPVDTLNHPSSILRSGGLDSGAFRGNLAFLIQVLKKYESKISSTK